MMEMQNAIDVARILVSESAACSKSRNRWYEVRKSGIVLKPEQFKTLFGGMEMKIDGEFLLCES